ncbi:sigma factor G inhibitor Gin [Metabacillus sp. FJAT-52054]|uniref:Sigma factor G inhibitor Gin n=1 Tax=Metabacillus sediminis TaxID=3117746 RepID=A0ABZ2NGU3_9BACI
MIGKLSGISKEETCIICDTCKPDGIHLYTSFICTDCEREMVSTDAAEPKYDFFVKKLKSVKAPPMYS